MSRDFELQRAVLDEVDFEPTVNAAEIGVAVSDGVVTLTGFVDSYAEKLAAERAAKRVHGVKAVAEEIEVRLPLSMKRSDTDIASAALASLAWNTMLPEDQIQVKVEDGWVTLEGELPWAFQRNAAIDAVRVLPGVRGVSNFIAVKPNVATQEIRNRILGAFRRSAELDAEQITVETADGQVTLSGKVQSWTERDEAGRVAWAAPGVLRVENKISVSM